MAAKGDDIQERLINFVAMIIELCFALPNTHVGKHIAGQLLRRGTSPASNYGQVRGVESKNDFVYKLGIVLKELNESGIWLEIIKRSNLLPINQLLNLVKECDELSKIISSSIRTRGKKS
ncbi:MAG: four helix bundle protein [bacterium]